MRTLSCMLVLIAVATMAMLHYTPHLGLVSRQSFYHGGEE